MIQIVELVRSVIPLMLNEVYEINLFEVYACAELDCVAQFFIIIIYIESSKEKRESRMGCLFFHCDLLPTAYIFVFVVAPHLFQVIYAVD